MACQHEDFEAEIEVGRIKPDEDTEVAAFIVELRVECADCGESFGFRGMPGGLSWGEPTRTPDALEARLPLLTPSELAMQGPLPGLLADPPPAPMPGFGIRVKGPE